VYKQQRPFTGTGDRSNPPVSFHGEKCSKETHCSTTDVDAMLAFGVLHKFSLFRSLPESIDLSLC
jgi:hypothetical protein